MCLYLSQSIKGKTKHSPYPTKSRVVATGNEASEDTCIERVSLNVTKIEASILETLYTKIFIFPFIIRNTHFCKHNSPPFSPSSH